MKYSRMSASLSLLHDDFLNQGPHAMMARPRAVPLAANLTGGVAPEVNVFIHCKEKTNLSNLPAANVHQTAGKVRTARVPLDRIEELTEHSGVTRIAPAKRLRPLDVASAKVSLPAYRAADPLKRTGKGVLIGIVDTGIDSAHASFAGRIQSVWDQTMAGQGWGTTNYGNVLTGAAMAASVDVNGHGTHVAGIAGGAHSSFGGVAPEASLVIIKTTFEDTAIADGVRYVFDQADQLGLPAVVNLSLGGHFDAHDGSDDLSAALDSLTGAGRIVVASAGNEGGDPIHGHLTIPAQGTVEMVFRTPPSSSVGAPPWVILNGWYAGNRALEVSVRTPAGNVTTFQPVISNGSPVRNSSFNTARVRVATPPATVNSNGDHQFRIEIQPGPFNTRVQGGTWRLRLRNPGNAAAQVDVWSLVDEHSQSAAFQPPAVSDDMKVGSPGAAASLITVASYTTRNEWVDSGGSSRAVGLALDDISEFSSSGPARNGAEKPDLAAPGAMIISCRSSNAQPRPANVVAAGFMVDAGTSMACPFVAGLVALLLQQKGNLTPAQVKAKLKAACHIPGAAANVTFDPKWGYGLIDASKL